MWKATESLRTPMTSKDFSTYLWSFPPHWFGRRATKEQRFVVRREFGIYEQPSLFFALRFEFAVTLISEIMKLYHTLTSPKEISYAWMLCFICKPENNKYILLSYLCMYLSSHPDLTFYVLKCDREKPGVLTDRCSTFSCFSREGQSNKCMPIVL